MSSPYLKLSLPKSISSTNNDNDTFSKDLLRQFDKKRSRLHFELGFASQVRFYNKIFFFSYGSWRKSNYSNLTPHYY